MQGIAFDMNTYDVVVKVDIDMFRKIYALLEDYRELLEEKHKDCAIEYISEIDWIMNGLMETGFILEHNTVEHEGYTATSYGNSSYLIMKDGREVEHSGSYYGKGTVHDLEQLIESHIRFREALDAKRDE